MLLPAAAVALALGLGGALVIRDVVETTHDRLLDGSVLAIAERLAVDEDNEVTVDLPRVALGMLESQAQDRIYYSVSYRGQLVTGYRDLPRPASELAPGPTGTGTRRCAELPCGSPRRRGPSTASPGRCWCRWPRPGTRAAASNGGSSPACSSSRACSSPSSGF